LRVVVFRRSARRFTVDQTGRTFYIKTQNPIADDLKSDVTNPRRIRAPAAIINFRQGKKPTALASILRSLWPTDARHRKNPRHSPEAYGIADAAP